MCYRSSSTQESLLCRKTLIESHHTYESETSADTYVLLIVNDAGDPPLTRDSNLVTLHTRITGNMGWGTMYYQSSTTQQTLIERETRLSHTTRMNSIESHV